MSIQHPPTKDSDGNLNGVFTMLVLGLEYVFACHIPAGLHNEDLGIVSRGVNTHLVLCHHLLFGEI